MARTRCTGTMMSRATPPKRPLNSMNSLPNCSALVASKLTFNTISPSLTYSCGTRTESSTCTAIKGVKPLSVHHSYKARMRYGRVDWALSASIMAVPRGLLAHDLFGWRQRLNVGGTREDALGILEQRCSILAEVNAVVVQAPEQRSDSHVQHGEVFTQHVLVLEEHGGQLGQAVADMGTGLVQCLLIALGGTGFQGRHVHEQFFFEVQQKQAHTGAVHGVTGHQLRMRETLIDVLIDDVRLVQDQVALDQNGHLTIGVHHTDVFGLVVQVHIANFEVHAFLKQHETATVRKGAGCS